MPDSPALPAFSLNPEARIAVHKIGHEAQTVFVVDNAVTNAEALVEFAAQTRFILPVEGSYYPGLVANIPGNYLPTLIPTLQRPLEQVFGLPPGTGLRHYGFFGLSTLAPQDMTPRQAMPHTDSANLNSFATVHYLSEGFGGTAFYRHKATGHEVITHFRAYDFNRLRLEEITGHKGAQEALLSEFYDEITYIEPVFNRLILYRATQLHSARLENPQHLSDDPTKGRLSINAFINT